MPRSAVQKLGSVSRRVAAVEHERDVGRAASSSLDPVDDRVAADLLLGVDREADVDGQLAGCREQLRRLEEHVQVRLVVGDPAGDELAVALDERPGVGLPELERVGRLDVEVRVGEDGRCLVARSRRATRRHERAPVPLLDLGACRRRCDPRGDPLRGARGRRRRAPGRR